MDGCVFQQARLGMAEHTAHHRSISTCLILILPDFFLPSSMVYPGSPSIWPLLTPYSIQNINTMCKWSGLSFKYQLLTEHIPINEFSPIHIFILSLWSTTLTTYSSPATQALANTEGLGSLSCPCIVSPSGKASELSNWLIFKIFSFLFLSLFIYFF